MSDIISAKSSPQHSSFLEIYWIFLRLGLTSFGGPVAHLAYFRQEFVVRRRWIDEHAYGDLVALCQFLPGPASSQVGMALGFFRGGMTGAIAAWLGFTLPSAVALVMFGLGLGYIGDVIGTHWLHGLKVVAVAVVAQAVAGMWKSLCPDRIRGAFAVLAAAVVLALASAWGQVAVIAAGGLFGWAFLRPSTVLPHGLVPSAAGRRTGAVLLSVFAALLIALPVAAAASASYTVKLFDSFYRAGALVFGGGHVVLPLLQAAVVPRGWVSNDVFLAGYGAAQAVPGPLFTFAAYLGAVSTQSPSGWLGAAIALAAIFLPAFLLIVGILPFWERLRRSETMQRAMLGINASVVGILLAALCHPVWTSAIRHPADLVLAVAAFGLLVFRRWPPWLVVILAAFVAGVGMR